MSNEIDIPTWISEKFKEYYSKTFISVYEIEKREFGFGGYDKKIEYRHLSFSSNSELNKKLALDGPHYVSYSAAYYLYPSARPMQKKNWLGADLVFDLDAQDDKLFFPFTSPASLEKIKQKMLILLNILLEDFGINKNEIELNFSGSRGYHLWVKSPQIKPLGRYARKEIADYIDGTDIDLSKFFKLQQFDEDFQLLGPKPTDSAYAKRLFNLIKNLFKDDKRLISYFGKNFSKAALKQKALADLEKGQWTLFLQFDRKPTPEGLQKAKEKFILALNKFVESEAKLNLGWDVDLDTQVSADTSKLLRLPNSLHGGSGLIAKTIPLDKLNDFDPFKDALAFSMQKEQRIKTLLDIPAFSFGGKDFDKIKKETIIDLPEAYAIYLVCKKAAIVLE